MRWSDTQRAMLREMGIPPFWPEEPVQAESAQPVPASTVAADRPDGQFVQAASAVVAQVGAAAPADIQRASPAVAAPQSAVAPSSRPASRAPASPSAPAAKPVEVPLGPRPVGVETMGWPALREAVAGCQACSLCHSRTQPVFGVGHEQAQWMIVGEAPGEQEDKQGEPFVGRAGQLLDRMLAALALTRSEADAVQQVFIANVLKCRPPANRNPQPQEVAQCEPFLTRQIELVKPKVILAMGRFAVQSLLKSSEPIGKLRGKVHEVAGVPVIVTYHPAYLLRSPADKALAWDDLCLAREVMRSRG
ncbi:MAG: uracil-DNA glycosylase [Aquabacterium sp.]|uniref:uracil-DNA glycosylase n=1 Tax=Aquabacterium sp. TaxID=1872578 RepID=UPI0012124204|nr:uracil-DNA glycosylase [Aquabacterium sp.]TAK98857.1 MAG: uracil-DNA glycosylase [Aquabacterium sp.]